MEGIGRLLVALVAPMLLLSIVKELCPRDGGPQKQSPLLLGSGCREGGGCNRKFFVKCGQVVVRCREGWGE